MENFILLLKLNNSHGEAINHARKRMALSLYRRHVYLWSNSLCSMQTSLMLMYSQGCQSPLGVWDRSYIRQLPLYPLTRYTCTTCIVYCKAIDLISHALQRIEFIFETIIMQDHIRSTCHIWILINISLVLSS